MRGSKGRRKGKGKSKEDNVEDNEQPSPTNSPIQSIRDKNDTGTLNTSNTQQFKFHFGGHFIFSPVRRYVNGREDMKAYEDDFVAYFEIRDDLVKYCQFNILEGDRFYYLKPLGILSDLDALEEVRDDGDVRRMVDSYKKCKIPIIDIYTLSCEYEIMPSTQVRNDGSGYNSSPEILQPLFSTRNSNEEELLPLRHANEPDSSRTFKRKTRGPTRCIKLIGLESGQKLEVEFDDDHQPIGDNATTFVSLLGQTVRNRSCCPLQVREWSEIKEESLEHMWTIILEKFSFEVPQGRKEAILGHMNALYRGYRNKLKNKYFDKKRTYQERLRNKPPRVSSANDWKYLVNLWTSKDFQDKSLQNKANRSKRGMPPYTGTKSFARLRQEMKKNNGVSPSRVDVWLQSRKRKNGKEIDPTSQSAINELEQLKKQKEEGHLSVNDDDMFEKVLGPEKHGYLRAYGPGKNITEYFGTRPTKGELLKQVEAAKKEAIEQVENARKEASERVDTIKQQLEKKMDDKIAEVNRQWEERIKKMFAGKGLDSSLDNQEEDIANEIEI